jgi:iron complex outermembrane recepter protein
MANFAPTRVLICQARHHDTSTVSTNHQWSCHQGSVATLRRMRFVSWLVPGAALLYVGTVGYVHAQAENESRTANLEEIIVTAQKRPSLLQETPLAISAVGGADLQQQQVQTIQDVAGRLPSLDFAKFPNVTLLAARGVGSIDVNVATESRVALHVDGVYMSRPEQGINQMFDVERVEYLRGPQGTLYGRNATAGAINIITRDPAENLDGYLRVGAGNYSALNVEAATNLPISDHWSSRVALIYRSHDGFTEEITSGTDVNDLETGAARAKLQYDNGDFKFVVSADYGKEDDNSGAFIYNGSVNNEGVIPIGIVLGGQVAAPPKVATDAVGYPETYNEYYNGSANARWQLGDNDVTAIVGYGHSHKDGNFDSDLTSAPLTKGRIRSIAEQISAELRFHRGTDQYDFLAGAYYLHETIDGLIALHLDRVVLGLPSLFVQGITLPAEATVDAYAAFSQLRWNFNSTLYAEVGARYSYEEKEAVEGINIDVLTPFSPDNPLVVPNSLSHGDSWSSFDPKITIGYKPSANVLAYATYSRGFKSGGFNMGGLAAAYDPEEITSYEIGVKLSSADRRITANLSTFYYDYEDMQVQRVAANGVNTEMVNAASSTIKGIEAEVRWMPLDSLEIGAGADYLSAKYDEFKTADPARPSLGTLDLSDNRLPQAPRYRARMDVTQTWQLPKGQLSLRGEGTWVDRVEFSPFNLDPLTAAASDEYNAFLTYEVDQWTVQLYGRNLTDERKLVIAQSSSALFGYPIQGLMNDPRTYGVSVMRNW